MKITDQRDLIFDPRALTARPIVGAILVSASDRRWSRIIDVTGLRRAGQKAGTTTYRITVQPIRKSDAGSSPVIIRIRPDWRQSNAKTKEPAPAIHPDTAKKALRRAKEARAESVAREALRVADLLTDDRRTNLVPTIRRTPIVEQSTGAVLRGPTVESADWLDPDDNNPNRRQAKRVTGFRSKDVFETMYRRGSLITAKHRKAVNRLRRDFEVGSGIKSGQERLGGDRTAFGPGGGPQDHQLDALRSFEDARAALQNTLFEVVDLVVLRNQHLRNYATRKKVPEDYAMGIFVSALSRLSEHYYPPEQNHTIAGNR